MPMQREASARGEQSTRQMAQACQFHQTKHLPQACQIYQTILERQPDHPEALHMLGVALIQGGAYENGIKYIQSAIQIRPTSVMWLHLGTGLLRLKRHDEAISALHHSLSLTAESPDALNNLGVALASIGKHEEALTLFSRTLHIRADFAECHSNRANSLRALLRINDAIDAAQTALTLQEKNPDTLNSLGLALAQAMRTAEALKHFERALTLDPQHIDTLTNRARILRQQGLLAEALQDYRALLRLQPDNAHAHSDAGLLLIKLNLLNEAISHFSKALSISPDSPELHNNMGLALSAESRTDEALESFDRALALRKNYAEAINNKANTLLCRGQAHQALPLIEQVCLQAPGIPQAHNNLGLSLAASNRHAEALDAYDQAISLDSGYAEAFTNRGHALEVLGQHSAALRDYRRALQIQPDNALTEWNMAQWHLRQGQFPEGWALYDARFRLPGNTVQRRFQMPDWQGQSLAGKSILLWCDPLLSDSIQFCRYTQALAHQGATLFLEAPAPLVELFAGLYGVVSVISQGAALPRLDFHCALSRLPRVIGSSLSGIPARTPYLNPSSANLHHWRQKIPDGPRKIALVGTGRWQLDNDKSRSLALRSFAPLLDTGAQFYLIQQDCHPEDAEFLSKHRNVTDLRGELADFAQTSAVLARMDLVICADHAIAHLAGALGRPLWIVLPSFPDWCWMLHCEDSPWYPTARLFRQRSPQDWDCIVHTMVELLRPAHR